MRLVDYYHGVCDLVLLPGFVIYTVKAKCAYKVASPVPVFIYQVVCALCVLVLSIMIYLLIVCFQPWSWFLVEEVPVVFLSHHMA